MLVAQRGWDKETLAESETEILRSARQSYTIQATAAVEGLRKRAAGCTRGGGDGHGCERGLPGGEQRERYMQYRQHEGNMGETRVVSDITRSKGAAARTDLEAPKSPPCRGGARCVRQAARISAGAWTVRSTVEDRQGAA